MKKSILVVVFALLSGGLCLAQDVGTGAVGPDLPAVAKENQKEEATEKEVEAAVKEEFEEAASMEESAEDRAASAAAATGGSQQLGSSALVRTEARTFNFSVPAPRGQILDRNGKPLAVSKVGYYAAINFPYLPDATENEILVYAGQRMIKVNDILETEFDLPRKTVLAHYQNRRWVPLTFSSVLTEDQVEDLKNLTMPGLILHPIYLRHYPEQDMLSHVLGYTGERPPRNLGPIVPNEPLWREGIGVGGGLEEHFDRQLTGTPGRINVIFEEDGSKVKEDTLARPRPGFNVVTTIDMEMQELVEAELKAQVKRGAMVIMDVRNGDIVAMGSWPQFNPNDFIPSPDPVEYAALTSDPENPMFPRSYGAKYPPASTFKVPVALAAMENRLVNLRTLYDCPTSWTIGDTVMGNWAEKPEGQLNVVGALMRSCNTWFYQVGPELGADEMSKMALKLGLGEKTGLPLAGESPGFIPTNRWSFRKRKHFLSDGEEANIAIGQGQVEASPIQIARMMAAVGNGYEVLKPRLVSQIQDINNQVVQSFPVQTLQSLNFQTDALQVVHLGMKNVVGHWRGTGKKGAHPKIKVAAKTGTGQWINLTGGEKQNLAWFAGYFPADGPVYSFAILYEGDPGEKVGGGSKAAPILGEFLKKYLTEENLKKLREESGQMQNRFTQLNTGGSTLVSTPIEEIVPEEPRPGGIFRTNKNRFGNNSRYNQPATQPVRPPAVQFGSDGLPIFNKPETPVEEEPGAEEEDQRRRGLSNIFRRGKGR